eukprot:scaffold101683_cov63-Phaeocystis_antarctica.AAC.5
MRARVRARVTVTVRARARASLGGCRRTGAHLHWHAARCDRLLRCRVGRDKPGRELGAEPWMLRPWLGPGPGSGSGSGLGLGLELGLGLGRASAPSLSTYTALPVQSSPSSYCSFTWSCQRHGAIRSVCRVHAWALLCPVGRAIARTLPFVYASVTTPQYHLSSPPSSRSYCVCTRSPLRIEPLRQATASDVALLDEKKPHMFPSCWAKAPSDDSGLNRG